MSENLKPIGVGDMVHGFCHGFFGRDHYDCMQVVETGPDWILLRSAQGDAERVEGFERLTGFIELRDAQLREGGCKYDHDYDNWGEGSGCGFRGAVQLTENGPRVLPSGPSR